MKTLPHSEKNSFDDLDIDEDLISKIRGVSKSEIQELTRQLALGDHAAWEALYLHMCDSVKNFLRALLHSEDDAFDIAQEVFINLWQNYHKIDPEKNISGYIYTLAKFLAFKHIRQKTKENNYVSSSLADPVEMDFDAEDIIMAKEAQILIRLSLEAMPEKRRRIFEMSRFEGLSNEEIADKLGLSRRTVESHIYNVTKELKELLACALILLLL